MTGFEGNMHLLDEDLNLWIFKDPLAKDNRV